MRSNLRTANIRAVSFLLIVFLCIANATYVTTLPSETPKSDRLSKIDPSLMNQTNTEDKIDILVGYENGVGDLKAESAIKLADSTAEIVEQFDDLGMYHVRMVGNAIKDLASYNSITRIWSNEMQSVKPINFSRSSTSSTDDYVPLIDRIGARELREQGYNGSGVVIAVLDTGIDFTHPDLDDFDDDNETQDSKVTAFASFVEVDATPIDILGHGTYAASIAAGTGNSSGGLYEGIAPGATLLSAKVTLGGLLAIPSWIVSGIEWASSRGADIILLPFNTFGAPDDAVATAVKTAAEKGIFVIAAAGDDGPDYLTVMSPGGSAESFTVGAYDTQEEEVPDFSGRGPSLGLLTKPDIVAPGVGVVGAKNLGNLGGLVGADTSDIGDISDLGGIGGLSGLLGGELGEEVEDNEDYIIADTTAASASIVAGAAALLIQAFDRATPIVLANTLRDTAEDLDYGANDAGAGLLNLPAAFDYLSSRQAPGEAHPRTTSTPLIALGILSASGRDASTSILMSSFGTNVIAIDTRNEKDSVHLMMGMFSLRWNNRTPTNLMEFNVKRELHQVVLGSGMNSYNRWIGILSFEDTIYVTLLVESYNVSLTDSRPITAFRITPFLLNLGNEEISNVSLFLSYSLGIFLDDLEDHGKYAIENQMLFAYGISETYQSFYFGVNSSRDLDAFEVGNSSEISNHVSEDNLTGSTNYDGDVGLGMKWDFDVLEPFIPENVTIAAGFAENRTILDAAIDTMWQLEPPAQFTEQGDLIVVEAEIPRTARAGETYQSTAVIMNIGEQNSTAVAALVIGDVVEDNGTLFTSFFNFDVIEPFHAEVITTDWSPELEDVYSAAWVTSANIANALQLISSPTEILSAGLRLLDDFLIRDLFVNTPIPSLSVFPDKVPFAPFDMRFPADFGLYSFTLTTNIPLGNITVQNYGNASDWGNMSLTPAEDVYGYYNFTLFSFVPPITMDGLHTCDYVIISETGRQLNVTLERTIQYPRAMMLMDTSHGGGFSIGGDIDLGGAGDTGGFGDFGNTSFPLAQDEETDPMSMDIGDIGDLGSIDELLEQFRLTTFSGLSNMKKTMASEGLDLVETPGMELDENLLLQFSAVIMFAPTEEFNSSEVGILRNFTSDGGKLVIFGDYEDRANLTAVNSLISAYGYRMRGMHEKDNTTNIVQTSRLGKNVDSIWLGGGTFIVNNQSLSCATVDGLPVVLLDDSAPEIALFSSSRIFMNKRLVENNNSILLDNLIEFLLDNTLTAEASLAEDTERYPLGQSVYINLNIYDIDGSPVDDLTVAIAFELPNGTFSFFIAGFVQDGLYSSQFLPSYLDFPGRVNGVFIILRSDYAGTYASTSFYMYRPPTTNGTDGPSSLLTTVQLALIISIGTFGSLIVGLVVNRFRRSKRMRIPEIDPDLMSDIDNTLNLLLATFTQMEDLIQREDLDRIQKVEMLRGLISGLDRARKEFKDIDDRVGGV